MRKRRPRTRYFIGLAMALVMLGAACSKSSSPSTTPTTSSQPPATSAAGTTLQQGAGGFVFSPATFSVKSGAAITVSNVGSVSPPVWRQPEERMKSWCRQRCAI